MLIKDLLLGSVFGVLHAVGVGLMNDHVPEPYMDEQFHIIQTREYCNGRYTTWHPLITTPPALYFLTILFQLCDRERFVNSLLVPFCFAGLCLLRRRYQEEPKAVMEIRLSALATLCLPVLLDISLLYYTDLLSLTAVIIALANKCPFHSFIAFSIALLTRQTNIVWIPFYCFPLIWTSLLALYREETNLYDTIKYLLSRLCMHAILTIGFIIFVIWNGAVVLGDRSAHKPVFHVPQLLYFCVFACASALPQFLLYYYKAFQSRAWERINSQRLLTIGTFSFFAFLAVHFCTMAHPYLLADNRHFTFYIWQRIFQRYSLAKYALIPVYSICAVFLWDSMAAETPNKIAFVISTATSLIPAHLFEFRYFIAPYAIWRLSLRKQPFWLICAELALHAAVNVLVLHLFFNHPFKWTLEPARWQRFMW